MTETRVGGLSNAHLNRPPSCFPLRLGDSGVGFSGTTATRGKGDPVGGILDRPGDGPPRTSGRNDGSRWIVSGIFAAGRGRTRDASDVRNVNRPA